MDYFDLCYQDLDVFVSGSVFTGPDRRTEIHLMLLPGAAFCNFEEQLCHLTEALERVHSSATCSRMGIVFKRYFLSDAANQYPLLEKATHEAEDCAVSVVQQPPLNGSKIALWSYLMKDVQLDRSDVLDCQVLAGSYCHIWSAGLYSKKADTLLQTEEVFADYAQRLSKWNSTLADNCIRTWLYVSQVDVNYKDVVTSRKDFFDLQGLNEDTHYLASTGIEGRHFLPEVRLLADAYAVSGIQPGQVSYLTAPGHLNPTHEYGVTFERGTVVSYGDRRHLFISGTASIDHKGDIVHPNNIHGQIRRTLENIIALLQDGGSSMRDLSQMIVYLRDNADYHIVRQYFNANYSWIPMVILLAPVCRPGWLIEIECIAISALKTPEFDNY